MKNTRATFLLLLLLARLFVMVVSAAAEKQLTQKQAEELLLNIPDAVAVKVKRGCPSLYLLWPNERRASLVFSMHNQCDKSGAASNTMGTFTIDLKRGEIWSGVDRRDDGGNVIDSPRLKELRRKFIGVAK